MMKEERNNLERLINSDIIVGFIKKNHGVWDHQTWLNLCENLKDNGYTPINYDKVGELLEAEKASQMNRCNSMVISFLCPYCNSEIIEPLYHFEKEQINCHSCTLKIENKLFREEVEEAKGRIIALHSAP
jgi:hypothetical protein